MKLFPGKRPRNLGVTDGKLAPCPNKPNCVSSQADDRQHAVQPLPLKGNAEASMQRIKKVLADMPRTEVTAEKPHYIHAECTSRVLGFVDDVEFFCDGDAIQVRSASRLGYSDLGVNSKRVEAIRRAYESG